MNTSKAFIVLIFCFFGIASSSNADTISYDSENLVPEDVSDCNIWGRGEWDVTWDDPSNPMIISVSGHSDDDEGALVFRNSSEGLGYYYTILPYVIQSTDIAFRLQWLAGSLEQASGSEQNVVLFWTEQPNGTSDLIQLNADIANNAIIDYKSILPETSVDIYGDVSWMSYSLETLVNGESLAGKYLGIAMNVNFVGGVDVYFDEFVVNSGMVVPEPSAYALMMGVAVLGTLTIRRDRK